MQWLNARRRPAAMRTSVLIGLFVGVGSVATSCAGSANGLFPTVGPDLPAIPQVPPQGYVPYPADSAHRTCMMADTVHNGTAMATVMDSLHWSPGCIPLYTDDQRLYKEGGLYGPFARIGTAPSDTFSVLAKFEGAPVMVGVVQVDTTEGVVLPPSYQALKLQPGFSCVFLQHTRGAAQEGGWSAFVTRLRQTPAIRCDDAVAAFQLPVYVYRDKNFADTSDYAPVGRFREATYAARRHFPMMGFKCVAAFCLINGEAGIATPHRSEHLGISPTKRTWQVFGWNDEQHVGMAPALTTGAALVQPQWVFNATVMAAQRLGDFKVNTDFDTGFVYVATVHLRDDPPKDSKYAVQFHYQKGMNYLFVHHNRALPKNEGWTAAVSHRTAPTIFDRIWAIFGHPFAYPLSVSRTDHSGTHVMGTARFKWGELDEDTWVDCDDGCCALMRPGGI